MKNKYHFLILCAFSSMLLAAQKKHDKFKFLGNVYNKINDTLYAASFEVTNADYREFLNTITAEEYEQCKVDSSRWVHTFYENYNDKMAQYYHTHPALNQYPVLCVPHHGAEEYCKWLSYRHYLTSAKKIIFRLPTENEWIEMSNSNPETKLPFNLLNGKSRTGEYLQNTIAAVINDTLIYDADGGFYTMNVSSYKPDSNNLYNIIGNAAEMTTEEGINKGGSWQNLLAECTTDKSQNYPTPDVRVGFRVIAIVPKRK